MQYVITGENYQCFSNIYLTELFGKGVRWLWLDFLEEVGIRIPPPPPPPLPTRLSPSFLSLPLPFPLPPPPVLSFLLLSLSSIGGGSVVVAGMRWQLAVVQRASVFVSVEWRAREWRMVLGEAADRWSHVWFAEGQWSSLCPKVHASP